MSSLADSFLEDIDDLNSDEEEEDDEPKASSTSSSNAKSKLVAAAGKEFKSEASSLYSGVMDEDEDDDDDDDDDENYNENMDSNIDGILEKIVEARASNSIGKLRKSEKYLHLMSKVRSALDKPLSEMKIVGALEDDPEYKLILSCNKIIQEMDEDAAGTHKYVCEIYSQKFPELESLITNKIDYIKTVIRIGNEMDMTLLDFGDILKSNIIMVVSVTGSTTSGKPLSEEDLAECFRACQEVLELDSDKSTLLQFIESRMSRIAPNLSNLIGSRVAAQIVGMAGGLTALSKIPACNIQVIGQERRNLAGFSNAMAMPHTGILFSCEMIQSCPYYLRRKALKVVAGKVALVARMDSCKGQPDGREGMRLHNELKEKMIKWDEPGKARTKKALPLPEEKRKSRRGGKRVRKMKERYAMTDLRAQQNKVTFSADVGEYSDSAMGVDAGMVGLGETGKARATQKKDNRFSKKLKTTPTSMSNSGATSGTSSLVFTPVQGMELVSQKAAQDRVREANAKWFNTDSGFLSAAPSVASKSKVLG